jgi:hypothetical protein
MRLMASLTEAEMKQASAKTCAEVVDAADRAVEREARRIMRARRGAERLRLTEDERYCHPQALRFRLLTIPEGAFVDPGLYYPFITTDVVENPSGPLHESSIKHRVEQLDRRVHPL